MIVPSILALLLVAGALLYVARPLVAAEHPPGAAGPDENAARRLALAEERDRALAAVRELEFDHRTGKVSDRDYRDLIGHLRRDAIAALHALDTPDAASGSARNP